MAIVQGATPALYKRARITMRDIQGQRVSISMYVVNAGGESDAAFVTAFSGILTALEAVSSAVVESANLENVSEVSFTTTSSPTASQFATLDQVLALNFQRANPLKANSIINRTFPIPAYIVGSASQNFPNAGQPNPTNPNMAAIIAFLNGRLAFRYTGDGLIYSGVTYVNGDSAGLSLPDIVDNR